MPEPIISVSGLRGVIGQSLTPEVAQRYVAAFASLLPPGPVVLGRDGRASGPMLAEAIRAALAAEGRDALDAGVAATPTVGVLVREQRAAGGVQITASHNPPEYNGLKLFSAEGRVLPAGEGERVRAAYRAGAKAPAPHDGLGTTRTLVDTSGPHARRILETIDAARIRRRKFRVVLDSNHGSGSLLGRHLLEVLGCDVTVLGDVPDGQFAHPPEPTAENLKGVLTRVAAAGADLGFCQDPDADRLAIIDERGRYLGEEYTLALCVDHVLEQEPGAVVTNCSTSRMTEDLCARYKVPYVRSAVGEANVVELMDAYDAVLGGEGNGGVIDPRVVMVRDSFSSMALVLDLMARREQPISALAGTLPRYEIVKTKITLPPEQVAEGLAALAARFPEAEIDRLDGLRLDWPGKWLLVRASNTEPIVRAIAEAPTTAEARALCEAAAEVLGGVAQASR